MTSAFAPLLTAAPIIQIHVVCALLAVVTALAVLVWQKGTRTHRWLGAAFFAAMMAAAFSSFGIQAVIPGAFSPIHILSVATITTLPLALYYLWRGNTRAHACIMLYNVAGLIMAGAFTFLPQRILGQALANFWR